MRPRCSAASRVPFGGCAALDAASAPCVWMCAYRRPSFTRPVFQLEWVSWYGLSCCILEHARPSLKSLEGAGEHAARLLPRLTKDPQAARATAVERER
jgi:hypothetical protein